MVAPVALDPADIDRAVETIFARHPEFSVGEADIRGARYRIFENAPANLADVIAAAAARHGEKEFLVYEDERISHGELWRRACRLAHAFRDRLGVRQGDKVVLAMRNYPEWCVTYMAVVALGATIVPLNAWWKRDELRFGVEDSDARIVVVDGQRLEEMAAFKTELGLVTVLARDPGEGADFRYEELLQGSSDCARPEVAVRPDDDFCILYTSGSTGRPKGVALTHRGIISALYSNAFILSVMKEARNGVGLWGDDPSILLVIPLFHVTGSHVVFLLSFVEGRRMVMMRKWDPREAARLIRQERVTNFLGVPTQSFELMEAAGESGLPTLVDIAAGGAKRPADQVHKLKEKFPNGHPTQGYGLTETNAMGCLISQADYLARPEATGRPVPPLTDVRIVLDGQDVGTDLVGEIWIKSAANFRGYHNLPEESAKAITADGWFRTGDLGRIDAEGFLYIDGRLKEIIIRGGENVSCAEVDKSAYEYEGVAEAVAFSVPDDLMGERVGLAVFAEAGDNIDPARLRAFLAARLAPFKVPERIWIWAEQLPRLGTAKFDKLELRSAALRRAPDFATGGKNA
ncbi:MAG TPA: class I adenylate-forming enzyme family protein [Allosphingosinicella sp.]|nr:class I adenylate-forming enzyme family protein [Allosphingosinicella sp.]